MNHNSHGDVNISVERTHPPSGDQWQLSCYPIHILCLLSLPSPNSEPETSPSNINHGSGGLQPPQDPRGWWFKSPSTTLCLHPLHCSTISTPIKLRTRSLNLQRAQGIHWPATTLLWVSLSSPSRGCGLSLSAL